MRVENRPAPYLESRTSEADAEAASARSYEDDSESPPLSSKTREDELQKKAPKDLICQGTKRPTEIRLKFQGRKIPTYTAKEHETLARRAIKPRQLTDCRAALSCRSPILCPMSCPPQVAAIADTIRTGGRGTGQRSARKWILDFPQCITGKVIPPNPVLGRKFRPARSACQLIATKTTPSRRA